MNEENNSMATPNLSRKVEYFVFQNPGLPVLCPDSVTVAAASKNKEASAPLFFFGRQRSEVMFSLHENPRFGLLPKGKPLLIVAISVKDNYRYSSN